jgi:DNA repair protein SbcD/Mre11
MRIIHTSDWHLGRRLKGIDRTPEIALALEEILEQAKMMEVDAVLVAGDVFDVPNPPAEAEKVAYDFFCQLQAANIPSVVIAGNHDSATRIDGIAKLLSYVGTHALGRPRLTENGGVIAFDTPSGRLCVGAMPFASERRLLTGEDLWDLDALKQRQSYQEIVAAVLEDLAQGWEDSSVNILMAHLTVNSAIRAYSEVDYYTRDTYSLSGQTLPPEAQYIALGHIHKPQQVSNAAPTYYSGSLIQVDFGEAGEEKGFNLVTVEPGRPAKVEFKPISCQKPLKVIRCDEINLDETLEANREHPGFLKVMVELNTSRIGLADTVRKVCPQALIIEPKYPDIQAQKRQQFQSANQFDAVEEFRSYWRDRVGTAPDSSVLKAFENLYQELSDATH